MYESMCHKRICLVTLWRAIRDIWLRFEPHRQPNHVRKVPEHARQHHVSSEWVRMRKLNYTV